MVHALESVHRLLAPDGVLIDIHPPALDATLEVACSGRLIHAGFLDETDNGIEYEQAEKALAEVVGRGLFLIEREARFTFAHYAPSLESLRQDLAATWKDAVIEDTVAARLEASLAECGPYAEVVLREYVRITRLRRLEASPHMVDG
jgi:hypothetical protein